MTIFKQQLDEEHLTVSGVKAVLEDIEVERATEDQEMRYELSRTIEHANQFAHLDPEESAELVDELAALEKVDDETAFKIADLLPRSRTELRAVFAHQRYALEGEELDEILDVVAKYA